MPCPSSRALSSTGTALTVVLALVSFSCKSSMTPLTTVPLSKPLIDSKSSLRVQEWSVDSRKVDLDTEHEWQVRKYVLHGGRQEGVDAISVDNGTLRYLIIPTRGMNLWSAQCGDVRLGWDSPVKEIVHPAYVNLDTRGGLGWLEGFGAWMCRCGLSSFGSPGTDVVTSNTGSKVEVQLSLHGKVSYIPASEVEVIVEPPPSRRIRVRGVVDETMMFGTQLRLHTEIWTTPGSKSLHIEDRIENLSAMDQEMEILYHCNFGAPLLEKGSKLVAPVRHVMPRNARAAEGGMAGWDVYGPPEKGFLEQVHLITPYADANGDTEALLHNKAGDRGVALRYKTAELPYLTMWKNTSAVEDGYVTGVEPGTGFPELRSAERKAGRVPKLAGRAVYTASLEVTALTTKEEVVGSRARIETIQGGRPTQVDVTPPK